MPKAKVESFRLNKEQMQFMKHYKETTKLHKALSTEFNKSLSNADEMRQALTEVEVSMSALIEQAKGFKFDKLDGQEDTMGDFEKLSRKISMSGLPEDDYSDLEKELYPPKLRQTEVEKTKSQYEGLAHRIRSAGMYGKPLPGAKGE
jgi:hypothetical protein